MSHNLLNTIQFIKVANKALILLKVVWLHTIIFFFFFWNLIAYSQNQLISMSRRQTLLVLAFIEKNTNDFSLNIASNNLYTPSCQIFLKSFK